MQSRGGSNGSDPLSHVYIQNPPISCNIPETSGLFYDDGTKLLLSPSSDQVLSWKIGAFLQNNPPNSDLIPDGEQISAIRFSLDEKLIAIQRSDFIIEFLVRENGFHFVKKWSEKIKGFFWTDCPTCDIIVVKSSGIEMLFYDQDKNNFDIIDSKKININWYKYSHESRMLILASGIQNNIISSYQFSAGAGVVKLPKFEMIMTKSEINSKPVLNSDDVTIITVYGRIYCLQFDKISMEINFHRFYRDAVVHQKNIQVYSAKVAINTVDNIILIHQIEAKVVVLYDIFLDSYTPISAPLPLLLRGVFGNNNSHEGPSENINNYYNNSDYVYNEGWSFLMPDLICDVDRGLVWKLFLDLEAIAASSSDIPFILQFLQRRRSDPAKIKELCLGITRTLILERRGISVISLSMDALAASYSHSLRSSTGPTTSVTAQPPGPTTHSAVGPTSVAAQPPGPTTHSAVGPCPVTGELTRSSVGPSSVAGGELTRSTGEINSDDDDDDDDDDDGADANPQEGGALNACVSGSQHIFVNIAISPDEMYKFVFESIEDEMSEDPAYLLSVILEFLRSASKEKVKINPNFYLMIIQLLARTNRYSDLILFISNKIIEPSKEVAMQLLQSGPPNSKIRKMGLDMLKLLCLHHDYVTFLLQDGFYLEALRYARKYKVISVQPELFLEAAMGSNKIMHLAAVMRFFSDFAPNFKSTLDFGRYQNVLSEIS